MHRPDLWPRARAVPRRGDRGRAVGAVLIPALVAALCLAAPPGEAASETPLPAGRTPSTIATMICKPKARQEIASVLGEFATVSRPTWANHLYSCQYRYPTGSMALSVKELSSWAQTKSYFHTLGNQMGDSQTINGLGQAAIKTRDGSIIVRKDWKVLLVNFGGSPRSVWSATHELGCRRAGGRRSHSRLLGR